MWNAIDGSGRYAMPALFKELLGGFQMKRNNKHKRLSTAPQKRKISEMIWEFAGDFIRLGTSPKHRQIRLNAASSAWNIACNQLQPRQKLLDRYMVAYLGINPDTDPGNAAAIRSDMEKLVDRKLKLFPTDLRQIVNAQLVPMGDKDRIEVVSAGIG